MRRLVSLLIRSRGAGWLAAVLLASLGGAVGGWLTIQARQDEILVRLGIEAERRGVEIMSQTLNGNVMGALALLGAVAQDIKLDARGEVPPNLPRISGLLEDVSRAHDAQGVFVVATDGIIHSSWDSSGRPSTGLNVAFRPYYQMAMRGEDNVYAAVSLARGDRALYFAAPVRNSAKRDSAPIGAVVARTDVERVDSLLRGRRGLALLLSPQGVVFAGSRSDWIGHLEGVATPERLQAIRDLRQFGALFEQEAPPMLPFAVAPGIVRIDGRPFALAIAKVGWNDPYGDWTLVLGDDLAMAAVRRDGLVTGALSGLILLVIAVLLIKLARGQHAQTMAARRIEHYANQQAQSAERKNRRAEAALRLQKAKGIEDLGRVFLGEAHDILGALQGAVYVFDRDGAPAMRLVASYAAPPDPARELTPGAGLLGQCVLDRRGRVLGRELAAQWSIRSGLGNARPQGVLMAPLMLDETALGAVEIAILSPPDAVTAQQFEELASLLALNLEIQRRQALSAAPLSEALS